MTFLSKHFTVYTAEGYNPITPWNQDTRTAKILTEKLLRTHISFT